MHNKEILFKIKKIIFKILFFISSQVKTFFSKERIRNNKIRRVIRIKERKNLIPKINSKKSNIIISLTTYGMRFKEVHYTLFSIFNQSILPDKVILWLDEDEFNEKSILNNKILKKYLQKGLEIKFCKNYASYKKFVPTLQLYPEATIIICDDDGYYDKNWLALLLEAQKNYPNDILCHSGNKIQIENNNLLPYEKWTDVRNDSAGYDIIPVGVGGTLFKYSFFYKDICNDKLFMEIAPKTDDLWLWAQAVLNNTKIRVIENSLFRPVDLGSDRDYPKLWINNAVSGNDKNINNIINYYLKLKELLHIQ